LKKLLLILLFGSIYSLKAQYFDITKVITDNLRFENEKLQNFYEQNINLSEKENSLQKIIYEIAKESNNKQMSQNDECCYEILLGLNYSLKNQNKEAIKYVVKSKRISEKLNSDRLVNANAVLASLVYRKMEANSSVVDEIKKCKNLKVHEQYQILLTKIVYQELIKDYVSLIANIEPLNTAAKSTSNYDYLYFSKKLFYFYLEVKKDYETALKYSSLNQSIIENFTQGTQFNKDVYYTFKPTIDDDYIVFEKIVCLSNRGTAYRLLNNLPESENSLQAAIELSKTYKAGKTLGFLYNNFGLTYTILKKYDKANSYYQLALSENVAQKKQDAIAETYNLIAKNELLRNQQQLSSQACQDAIKISEKNSDYKNLAASYFILSEVYQINNDYLNAQKNYKMFTYYSELSEKSKVDKNERDLKVSSEALVSISAFERDFSEIEKNELELLRIKLESEQRAQELLLLKKENELKEKTLLNQQLEKDRVLKSLALIQQQLEKEKLAKDYDRINKDREIKGLENEKSKGQISLLNSQKTIYEKEKILKSLEAKSDKEQKKYLTIGLVLMGFVFLLFAFFLYRNNKQRKIIQGTNIELERITDYLKGSNAKLEESVSEINKQKQIIETKNYQIVESINYSLRIQEALLFNEKELTNFFKDSFIISRAKDIVNGDFFLVTKKRNKIYAIVADCTGHGVPGALLSIIGYEEISHLIEYHNYSPAQILEKLNTKINQLLNSDKQVGSDGMDVMLLELDTVSKTLTFAGARSYLLVYDNNCLTEYKGDRISIGEFTEEKVNFNNHQLEISENTKIYMYSDGFQDQQTEKNLKRIGSKVLKQAILDSVEKPFNEQRNRLLRLFEEQKGGNKQTDDVTVLGFAPSLFLNQEELKTENPKIRQLLSSISNDDFSVHNLVVVYGQMNQDVVISTVQLIERKLNIKSLNKGYINRIKSIATEILQNITKHQYTDVNYSPYFILNESNGNLNLYSGNVISIEDKDFLNEKLKLYQEISVEQLKSLYVETYSNAILTEEGNAGLGLLTIAIKAKQDLRYEFVKINDNFYHYNLEITIAI
jgi:serine phosphatase RsbU (regulator of sigma subunit)